MLNKKTFSLLSTRNHGFTLIELLIVIVIISILSVIGIAVYTTVLKNARDSKRQGDLSIIRSSVESYFLDQKRYPPYNNTTTSCVNGYFKSGCSLKGLSGQTYLNQIPVDPKDGSPYLYKAWSSNNIECTSLIITPDCVRYCLYAKGEGAGAAANTSCEDQAGYSIEMTAP